MIKPDLLVKDINQFQTDQCGTLRYKTSKEYEVQPSAHKKYIWQLSTQNSNVLP